LHPVGKRPFPSELATNAASGLRTQGREFGVTDRPPGRCGWYDAVCGAVCGRLNGLDALVITKLDVLSGFERLASQRIIAAPPGRRAVRGDR